MKNRYAFLTAAPIPRVIGTMALPTILSMMVTSLYNVADTYFVSRINTQSTAAVGIVFTVMALFQAVGFLFGHGSGNFIAIRLGAGDRRDAEKMAVTSFVYALALALVMAVAGLLALRSLCLWLGCTPTIQPYAEQYLRSILWGTPFIVGAITLNVQIRQQGNAAYAMAGILSGAVLNILLDPLLIFTCGLGIRGAGLATAVSQAVSFAILLCMTARGGNLRLRLRNFRPEGRFIRGIFAGGTPSLTRQGLGSVATLLLNVSAAAYGDAAIAAMTIVTRITFLVYSAVIGLGQGYQPLCGFSYGARLYDRVIRGYWFCVAVGTLFLSAIALFGSLFAPQLIALFRDEAEVVRIGSEALRWQFATYPLGAVILLSNMVMQSMNKPIRANLLAAARRGLFFIPFLLVLPRRCGLWGVEICQPLADICAFGLSLPILLCTFRRMRARR